MQNQCESIVRQFDFNLRYAKALVQDISAEQMTQTPADGLENHPAWTLGHLVSACALIAEDMGAEFVMPDKWPELFLRNGPRDPRRPEKDAQKYPSKELLLEELELQHNKVKDLLATLSNAELDKELKWKLSGYMPTLRDIIAFFCINHEAMHLGQLAAWRRALGLPSALAGL